MYQDASSMHSFDHVLRVTKVGVRLAMAEGADVEIVRTASLLHDVCRQEPEHHLAGARRARQLLRGEPREFVESVAECIEAHTSGSSPQPSTIEAKCLADADTLDAIGAIGIARLFASAGAYRNPLWVAPLRELRMKYPDVSSERRLQERQDQENYSPSHEMLFKLEVLAGGMSTASARKLAEDRHEFMLEFFDQLDREASGET
jgi:uncharacterized protein